MSAKKISTRHYFEYFFLILLNRILTPLPAGRRRKLAVLAGYLFYYIIPIRKKVVISNLRGAFPDASRKWCRRIARRTYIHYAKVYFDLLPLYQISDNRLLRLVDFEGEQALQEALDRERGLLLIVFHFGNWEVFADWLARKGYRVGGIAARMKNPLAHRLFSAIRSRNGIRVFIKGRRGNVKVAGFLRDRNILYIISDQDARRTGVWVRFFGRWSSTFRGPAIFMQRRRCPVFLVTCQLTESGRYRIELQEFKYNTAPGTDVDNIREITQKYTEFFEKQIHRCPEQYYWFHRRWKTPVPPELKETG